MGDHADDAKFEQIGDNDRNVRSYHMYANPIIGIAYQGPDYSEVDAMMARQTVCRPSRRFTTVDELSTMINNIKEESDMTNRVPLHAPQFRPGEIIDLKAGDKVRDQHTGKYSVVPPNRLQIQRVFTDDCAWKYLVLIESDGKVIEVDEKYIIHRMSQKSRPVYELDVIKKRYNTGWRYCGKFGADMARDIAKDIARSSTIKSVRMTEAYYPDGTIAPGKLAIWIMYYSPIGSAKETSGVDIVIK